MGFLKLLHGTKKRKDLFDIACDYDGYDIVYEEETTDINLYKFFNEIITNSRYDITVLSEYRLLMEIIQKMHLMSSMMHGLRH